MNQTVKQLWIDALRSGDYEQGKGTLTYIGGDGKELDCCLGVLCKVAIANGVKVKVDKDLDRLRYDDVTAYIPDSVMEWADMADGDPELAGVDPHGDDEEASASVWNDVVGADFDLIADLIDANL